MSQARSNILLNPRRISVTHTPLAKEQPESFAKFMDPLNPSQNCGANGVGVMTQQHLGTVAFLDLEPAAELESKGGARDHDGVDTMVSLFSVDFNFSINFVCLWGTPMFTTMDRLHYRKVSSVSSRFLIQTILWILTQKEYT
jgi:hypothetical protein